MNLRQQSWQDAIVCLGIGAIASYCILSIMEKKDFFQEFFEEKFPHEVKRNLSGVFLTIAALEEFLAITIGEPMLVNVVIIVWGFGDAAAALVGIPFGKHKLPIADKKKSIEGSIAFVLVSTVLTSMFMAIAMPGMEFIVPNIVAILLAAIVGSIVEVIAKDKWDNLIVPVAIA
ncbi:MAG: phosphatidate cytidylyltransferase, partial [Lachnospiraceae bacterium]|nr:phosphatidate cytidylyltransferase [Lachnospiraceae bacterium]